MSSPVDLPRPAEARRPLDLPRRADLPLVLVVEDEESFVDALEQFACVQPDIVLLDVMLPHLSGIDVCRELRSCSDVPIIMVTAKSAEIDAVVGLEVGADDYITKPYRLRELVARMRAVLRRTAGRAAPEPPGTGGVPHGRHRLEVGPEGLRPPPGLV